MCHEQSRLDRARRDGLSHGRPSQDARAHDVTVYNRTRAKAEAWVAKFGGRSQPRPPRRRTAPRSCSLASAMTTICARSRSGQTAPSPAWQGRDLRRQHHRLGRHRPRAPAERQEARRRLPRRAGVGRPGGRRERQADRDVRRRAGRSSKAKPVIDAYAQGGQADRARRARASSPRWSTRSASPASSRAWPRRSHFAPARRPRHREGDRRDLQGRGAELADGQSLARR